MPQSARVVFLLVLLGLLGGLSYYLHFRLVRTFQLGARSRRALAAVLLTGLGCVIVSRALGDQAVSTARFLGQLGASVTMTVVITACLLGPWELARGLLLLWRKWTRRAQAKPEAQSGPHDQATAQDTTRREFLEHTLVGGATALGAGAAFHGTWFGRTDFETTTLPLALPRFPSALSGYRILQLSDVHIGLYIGESELALALDRVRQRKPDLIVLTGDLLDHDVRLAPVLGRWVRQLLPLARHGVAAILGNHDHYAGAEQVHAALQQAGAQVLNNQHVRLGDGGGEFVLAGVDDVYARRYGGNGGPNLEAALRGAPQDLTRVLLCHNPSFYPEANSRVDLQLSGHTHGGQITLFINPAQLVLPHGRVRGHYQVGASQLYVNRGFGTAGPPTRVGSPPEISEFVLTPA